MKVEDFMVKGGFCRIFIMTLCLVIPSVGCGKTNTSARGADSILGSYTLSPELEEIDRDLDALDAKMKLLKSDYEALQGGVLDQAYFSSSDTSSSGQLVIVLNINNVLIVNGRAMTRGEFSTFAEKNLPSSCSPTPSLTIQKSANYDIASWVLEMIYLRGCPDVTIH